MSHHDRAERRAEERRRDEELMAFIGEVPIDLVSPDRNEDPREAIAHILRSLRAA